MFKEARLNLTVWYLAIIMTLSASFSAVIYYGINSELRRIEHVQKIRLQRLVVTFPHLAEFVPQEVEAVAEARHKLLVTLGFINLSILILAGGGGYFLAGQTLDPIKRNMDEQKTFVSDASHELRTPITSIRTEIEVSLRDKNLNLSDAKKQLKSTLEDIIKMQSLANYLLELNKYDNKKLEMKKIDLKKVAEEAVGKRKLVKNFKSTFVKGNHEALVEMVSTLVDNALKFSPKDKKVIVNVSKKKIKVIDKGIGISREDLPHIFDRFYRSDKSRGTEGYGLGLSIAKSIAVAHGASISVKSQPGRGSEFTVSF